MSRRTRRLTPRMLRRLVLEEKARMIRESDPIEAGISDPAKVSADEVEAGDEADTIAKDIDIMAVLKIEETKLKRKLRKINEAKKKLRGRIVRSARRSPTTRRR
jgi:hypothetical protein